MELGVLANDAAVPWAWGINGSLSVVSTVLAAILAVQLGFSALPWIAAAYLVAAAAQATGKKGK